MQKIRYELDPYNRLVINMSGEKSILTKFRKVLDGRFKIDEDNNLSYHIKSPLSEEIPNQLKLKGEWSLTDGHDLRLTLDKEARDTFGDQLTLQGEILDVNEDSLLFAITTKTDEGEQSTYVLNLAGSWKADQNNRLSFYIRKEDGRYNILTFNAAWDINKDHQIIYQYEKVKLIKKKREVHSLIFKGHWDIKDAFRISYSIGGGTDSAFEFSTGAGIFKEDYIKYEIGIGLANRKEPIRRTITLSGKWNLKKDVGLIFGIEYEGKKIGRIVFGADARLTDNDTVLFKLKDDTENKEIGAELELSHEILKGDGEVFLRILASQREAAILAGAAWRW